jgi:hypothetical protein
MSSWDNLREQVNQWSQKINAAVDDLADQTALQIKLSTRRGELEKEFATLGKLTYQRLDPSAIAESSEGIDSVAAENGDTLTEQINQSMNRITAIMSEIKALEARLK